jgi:hypothetical protein
MKNKLFFLIILLYLSSCEVDNSPGPGTTTQAWVPIYMNTTSSLTITVKPVIPTVNAGKIYSYGNYIFQNEQNKGIHVIDNSNKANPVKISFIDVPLSTEISVKDGFLYTNNGVDLVALNINNINNITVASRLPNVFPLNEVKNPPFTGWFECVDETKGVVVGWELKNNVKADCRR